MTTGEPPASPRTPHAPLPFSLAHSLLLHRPATDPLLSLRAACLSLFSSDPVYSRDMMRQQYIPVSLSLSRSRLIFLPLTFSRVATTLSEPSPSTFSVPPSQSSPLRFPFSVAPFLPCGLIVSTPTCFRDTRKAECGYEKERIRQRRDWSLLWPVLYIINRVIKIYEGC